jgi:hypothetical protein
VRAEAVRPKVPGDRDTHDFMSRSLTSRPRVPVLIHVAALSLAGLPGCGDDGDGSTTSSTTNDSFDDHPTACHGVPSCDFTLTSGSGPMDSTSGTEGSSSGTAATETKGSDSGSTTAGDSGTSGGTGSSSGGGSGSSTSGG